MEVYKTTAEAEIAYRSYLKTHISNVEKAMQMFTDVLMDLLYLRGAAFDINRALWILRTNVKLHDGDKYNPELFNPYRAKLFTSEEDLTIKSMEEIERDFKAAVQNHYNHNPHHPEFWYGENKVLKGSHIMANSFMCEMLLDWIAVSMTNMDSVYDWWISEGREKKGGLLPKEDLDIIDKILETYKGKLDFSGLL